MMTQEELDNLQTRYMTRLAPLPLHFLPDSGFTNTASPFWNPTTGGTLIQWSSAHATQNLARCQFRLPAGVDPARPVLIKGLMAGTGVSENTTIRTNYSVQVAGEAIAWDTTDSEQQTSIAIAANLVEVTILNLASAVAGAVISVGFRPRTAANANVTQNKTLLAVWLV